MSEFINNRCLIFPAIFATACFFFSSFLLGKIIFSGFQTRRKSTSIIIFTLIGANLMSLFGLLFANRFDSKLPFLPCILLPLAIFADDRFRKNFFLFFRIKNIYRIFKSRDILDYGLLPLLFTVLLILGRAFSPPVSWDELIYQIAVPRRWMLGIGNEIYADNPYSAFPSLSGIVFRILLSNGDFLAPRIAVLLFFVITAFSLNRILSPLCGRFAKIAINAAFCMAFPVLMISSSAYSEIFILANFAGGLLLLQEKEWIARKNGEIIPWVLCGILTGAASAVKLTGFAIIPIFLVFIFSNHLSKWRITIAPFCVIIVALTFSGIFYLRPYLLTGNPFYPYFASLFSADSSTLEMSLYHHAIATEKYGVDGLRGLIFSPLMLACGLGQFDGPVGLQFFILFFAALFSVGVLVKDKNFDSFRFRIFIVSVLLYLFWFFSSRQSRFIVPSLFALSIASSYALSMFYSRKMIFWGIILLSIISIPAKFAKDCIISWKTVIGENRKIDYVYSATGGYLKACDLLKSEKVENKKVLLLFEHRGLYIPCDYLICTPFFQGKYFTPPEKVHIKDLQKVLKTEKITHVLVGLSLQDPDRLPNYLERSAKIAELLGLLLDRGILAKIWDEEGVVVFRVKK